MLRLIILAYIIACAAMLFRFIAVGLSGVPRSWRDLLAIFIFPLLLFSDYGRTVLARILLIERKR